MHTSTFNKDPFYTNGASARFAAMTNDTGEVVVLAVRLGERLRRDGFRYSKCGVMISELLPEEVRQPTLLERAGPGTPGASLEDSGPAPCNAQARHHSHPRRGSEGCGLETAGGASLASLDHAMG